MQLSEQIRQAIRKSGQSVYRIALQVRVDQTNLRSFVKGNRGLSMNALDRLADYFHLTLNRPSPDQSRQSQ